MTDAATQPRTFQGLAVPQPGTFELDPAHTRVGFVARHLMVSKVRGNFGEVSGRITFAENPLDSTVDVTINAASIHTNTVDRDNHLRSADFLNVEKYPEITFRGTRVKSLEGNEFVLAGELTILDVTREVDLVGEYEGVVTSPYGKEVVGFSAKAEIDREDFGVTWNVALETGGFMVSKKIQLEIEAEAIRVA